MHMRAAWCALTLLLDRSRLRGCCSRHSHLHQQWQSLESSQSLQIAPRVPKLIKDVFQLASLAEPELSILAQCLAELHADICWDCAPKCHHLQSDVKLICHLCGAIWKLHGPDCLCMLWPNGTTCGASTGICASLSVTATSTEMG